MSAEANGQKTGGSHETHVGAMHVEWQMFLISQQSIIGKRKAVCVVDRCEAVQNEVYIREPVEVVMLYGNTL
jgi:hypothetical protein